MTTPEDNQQPRQGLPPHPPVDDPEGYYLENQYGAEESNYEAEKNQNLSAWVADDSDEENYQDNVPAPERDTGYPEQDHPTSSYEQWDHHSYPQQDHSWQDNNQRSDQPDNHSYSAPESPYGGQQDSNHNQYQQPSNWVSFLVEPPAQRLFAWVAFLTTFTSGIGIGLAVYYLFYLDESHSKDKGARMLSWISVWIAVVILLLAMVFAIVSGVAD